MSRKEAPYHCTYENCSASFPRSDRLENHIRTHTGQRPFVCEYEGCDKSYVNASNLKRHEAAHESTFQCTVEGCSEILKTKDTLKRHIDNFHLKKKHKLYKCTECDKEFNKHNWLQRHMYKHTGTFPYKCDIEECGKGFLLPSKLKRHMKVHEGHLCKIPGCEKVFLKWSLYVAHLKEFHPPVHKCDICDKEFTTSSNLKAHFAVHEDSRKVFPCEMPNCTRFYYAEKNLNWHIKSYHEARPHVCDKEHCHKAFKTKDALDHHASRHIRRKSRKKKKPRPSFSAILSGCADPRKFTRKMPPKRTTSESSDDFTTDEEIVYEGTSSEDNANKNSHSEMTDSGEHVAENQAGPSQPRNSQFSKIPSRKRVKPESSDIDSSCEETPQKKPHSEIFAKIVNDCSTPLSEIQKLKLNQKSIRKRIRLETCKNNLSIGEEDLQSNSISTAIEDDPIASTESIQSHSASKSIDEGASSSEYEAITVTVFGNAGYRNYSESDDVSSCLSEAEDLLNCNDICSRRER